jgi:hypothetical protein
MRATALVAAVAFLAAFGSGCRSVNVSSDYRLDPSKNLGLVVVSLTMAGLPSGFNVFINYRGVDVSHKSSIPVSDMFASADWRCPFLGTPTEENPCGRLAVVELTPGEYEFYSWEGGTGGGPGSITFTVRSVADFSKRFKVVSGKAVYLGNIHFSIQHRVVGRGAYQMRITDLRDRDLTLLHSKHPSITPDGVVISLLD